MLVNKHYKYIDNNEKHEKVEGGAIPLIPIFHHQHLALDDGGEIP